MCCMLPYSIESKSNNIHLPYSNICTEDIQIQIWEKIAFDIEMLIIIHHVPEVWQINELFQLLVAGHKCI